MTGAFVVGSVVGFVVGVVVGGLVGGVVALVVGGSVGGVVVGAGVVVVSAGGELGTHGSKAVSQSQLLISGFHAVPFRHSIGLDACSINL